MNLCLDTSALVKLFHEEEGSEIVKELILRAANSVWVLDLVRLEFLSAVLRRFRMAQLNEQQLQESILGFIQQAVHFNTESISRATLYEAESLLMSYGKTHGLRALDALHLAACTLIADSDWIFVCADQKLCGVAEMHGIKTLNPVSRSL